MTHQGENEVYPKGSLSKLDRYLLRFRARTRSDLGYVSSGAMQIQSTLDMLKEVIAVTIPPLSILSNTSIVELSPVLVLTSCINLLSTVSGI